MIRLVADGFDEAIIGHYGQRVVYDYDMVIDILIRRNKWDRHEAVEYFEFNIEGAAGDHPRMPMFIQRATRAEIDALSG